MKLLVCALIWLIAITGLHHWLNNRSGSQTVVRMGYMPVITNLAAPLLDRVSRDKDGVHFQAVKFSSFAEMAEALRNNSIQAAFIIAPLAIVLHQQGVDVKVVLIGNRHESTLVAHKRLNARRIEDLEGATVAVPMRYSGHNLCLMKVMEHKGLVGKINVVEMNPPDMASALTSGALDAYFVGEPFAAQTVISEDADVVNYVESLWPGFICNLVLVKRDWLDTHPSVARSLVEAAARSGVWAGRHPQAAAKIASTYWNQSVELVQYALTSPANRIVYDRFVPIPEELKEMADLMVRYGLIKHADIDGLVDDRLARAASVDAVEGLDSVLLP
jgi:NitT/TauT family transport system substrate-binding protein